VALQVAMVGIPNPRRRRPQYPQAVDECILLTLVPVVRGVPVVKGVPVVWVVPVLGMVPAQMVVPALWVAVWLILVEPALPPSPSIDPR
jgi:hypothetical protein